MPAITPEYYLKQLKQNALNPDIACGYEAIIVDGTVKQLSSIPVDAKYGLAKLVSDVTGNAAMVLQFYLPVSSTAGIPIKDESAFDITGAQNLAGFNITQITAGTTILHIEYYK